MKNIISLIAITLFLISGCTGVKSVSSGLENEAFLRIMGDRSKYSKEVTVSIDDEIEFQAEVSKLHSNRPKGEVYAISTGSHVVSVSFNGELVFRKKIFVSSQETRKIILP